MNQVKTNQMKSRIIFSALVSLGLISGAGASTPAPAPVASPAPAVLSVPALAPASALWNSNISPVVPTVAEIPQLKNVKLSLIKAYKPKVDGFKWSLGVSLAWHQGKLYALFAQNKGEENNAGEQVSYRVGTPVTIQDQDGKQKTDWSTVNWGPVQTLAAPELAGPQRTEIAQKRVDDRNGYDTGISHGVFLSTGKELWAFLPAFGLHLHHHLHTAAYLLNPATGKWELKASNIGDKFWPTGSPVKMQDGNWIMAGLSDLPNDSSGAVAISNGNDFTSWRVIRIGNTITKTLDPDTKTLVSTMWGESAIIVNGQTVQSFARYDGRHRTALVAQSNDFGKTWSEYQESNLPMDPVKPYAGILRNGQRYLIGTTRTYEADSKYRQGFPIYHPIDCNHVIILHMLLSCGEVDGRDCWII